MDIKIFNFGPIHKFESCLTKDLSIIYGKNNIGKSYAISVVYLLLKYLLEILHLPQEKLLQNENWKEKSVSLEGLIRKDKESNISKQINSFIKSIFNDAIAGGLENSFENTFGKLSAVKNYKVKDSPLIRINLLGHEILIEIKETLRVTGFTLNKEIDGTLSNQETGYSIKNDRYQLFLSDGIDFNEVLKLFIGDRLRDISNFMVDEFGEIFFLPASRSGLFMGMQSLIPLFAELSKNRSRLTRKIELPAIPEPIADYILLLSEIRGIPTEDKELIGIVRSLETEILGGEIGFDSVKGNLTYIPYGSRLNLDMNSVSSMVSELSPLAAFLKYLLMNTNKKSTEQGLPKPVFFIEEPEAHLHPEAQVKLVDLLIKLIDFGMKVIVSSHSNYIFNRLSNMLIAGTFSAERFAPVVLKETPGGSECQLMNVDELGIEDENFIDIADFLYEEREKIIESINSKSDD